MLKLRINKKENTVQKLIQLIAQINVKEKEVIVAIHLKIMIIKKRTPKIIRIKKKLKSEILEVKMKRFMLN